MRIVQFFAPSDVVIGIDLFNWPSSLSFTLWDSLIHGARGAPCIVRCNPSELGDFVFADVDRDEPQRKIEDGPRAR